MNPYNYMPLRGPSSFRLLHIFQDNNDDRLRAHMVETTLEEKPDFVALSYVWGTDVPQIELQIDNQSIKIRKSLADALRRLRKWRIEPVWIDAVCINQVDLPECEKQVMIMCEIYQSATLALVYLGETDRVRELQTIFDAMLKFCGKQSLASLGMVHTLLEGLNFRTSGLPDALDSIWEPFIQLLDHPWFSRAWTYQEILVAKRSLFVCGDWWEIGSDFLSVLCVMKKFHFAPWIDRVNKTRRSPVDIACARGVSVIRHQRLSQSQSQTLVPPFQQRQRLSESRLQRPVFTFYRPPLIELLQGARDLKCTLPHDHMYALLGLSQDAGERDLKPCYLEDVDQTRHRYAKYFVEHNYGLQVLANAALSSTKQAMKIPSWVPRWHVGLERFNDVVLDWNAATANKLFAVAGQTESSIRLHKSGRGLIVQAVVFDTIDYIGSSKFLTINREVPTELEAIKMINTCISEIIWMLDKCGVSCMDIETTLDIICRLSVCDQDLKEVRKARPTLQRGLQTWILAISNCFVIEQEWSCFVLFRLMLLNWPQRAAVTQENRDLGIEFSVIACDRFLYHVRAFTRDRYLFQVSPNTQIGDKVVLIKGCEVPYVLRPVNDHQYILVNTCYVHGIMYGEGWTEKSAQVQEIEII